jgi:hypothetical protein
MAKSERVQSVALAATADGDNTVIAAQGTGKKIRVLGYALNINAPGTVQWKSNTTALSGAMEFVDGGGLVAPMCDPSIGAFWFETAANEALVITNATGVDSLGHVTYLVTA